MVHKSINQISIKQNRNGTFLDLSKGDFCSPNFANNFISNFSDFSSEISSFLSGTSVSLIMPAEAEKINLDGVNIIDKLKEELNQRNISVKAVVNDFDSSIEEPLKAKTLKKTKSKVLDKTDKESEKELIDTSALPETLYVKANLRSGQLVQYPGNVFVLGDVNPSAEIIADGDVIIWGTLRGIVHAGARGDKEAKVIAIDIKGGQIRIFDKLASLNKKNSPTKSSNGTKIPLLAKIENNEIIITRYF